MRSRSWLRPLKRLTLDGGQHADRYSIQFSRLFGSVHVNDSARGSRQPHPAGHELTLKKCSPASDGTPGLPNGKDRISTVRGNDVPLETIEIAHEGIQLAEVRAGDGDDLVEIDDRSGLLHPIDINVFFQGGRDCGQFYSFHPGQSLGLRGDGSVQFIGEELNDHLTIIGSDLLGERLPHGRRGKRSCRDRRDRHPHEMAIGQRRRRQSSRGFRSKGGDGDDEFDIDVNEDGLVTPVDVLGGGGNDRLTVVTTHLAELIEILASSVYRPTR